MQTRAQHNNWTYRERLLIPWWYIPIVAIVISIIVYEILIASRYNSASYWAIIPLTIVAAWILFSMSRTVVGLSSDGIIYAGNARIPVSHISRTTIIDKNMKQAALGRQLDPRAFVLHRGWIKDMVILVLEDPNNLVPYWIISTKQPDKFLNALPPTIEIRR